MDEAERCAHVIVMHEGRMLGEGTPQALRERARGLTFSAEPAQGERPRDVSSLRWLSHGSSPAAVELLRRTHATFPDASMLHIYGLTETYGPYTVGQWQEDWRALEPEARARLQARQGVAMLQAEPVRVVQPLAEDADPATVELVDVPADATTMGEIVMAGNNVMSGYYRDPDATARAFAGGRTPQLTVSSAGGV